MPRFFKASSDAADAAYTCAAGGGDGFRRTGAGDKDVSRIAFTGSSKFTFFLYQETQMKYKDKENNLYSRCLQSPTR